MTIGPVRTLFVTKSLPYPPMGGAPLRNWQNINIMRQLGSVAVFTVLLDQASQSSEPPPGVTQLTVHYTRDRQSSLWEKLASYQRQLRWLGIRGRIQADGHYKFSIAQELKQVLADFQPHLVVFEELWLYYYLPTVKRHPCRVIYDAHNVEASLRSETYQVSQPGGLKGIRSRLNRSVMLARTESIERDLAQQADQVWVCSERDASLLQTLSHQPLQPHVVPNGVDLDYYDSIRLAQQPRPPELKPSASRVIFPAAFGYQPNALAAQFLLEQVCPHLQQHQPDCQLLLVGTNPTEQMQQVAAVDPRVIVTGKVPDMRPYLAAAKVMIVPLLQGGGTRLKILEAFASGLPVVSTTKGAEGLRVKDGKHLLIGDSAEALAAGVQQLWTDPALAQRLSQAAYELVKREYSWDVVGQTVKHATQLITERIGLV